MTFKTFATFLAALCCAQSAWAVSLVVGAHDLQPNKSGQVVPIYAVGPATDIQGLNFRAQLGDGGPIVGGTDITPIMTGNITGPGALFRNNYIWVDDFSYPPSLVQLSTTTISGSLSLPSTPVLLGTLTFDTFGFFGGSWPLIMSNTIVGSTNFAGGPPLNIIDGSITVLSHPSNPGQPTVLNFEDLGPDTSALEGSYGGLEWNHFATLDGTHYGHPSGYVAGVISPDNVAFNNGGEPASITGSHGLPFNFIGTYLTASSNDGLNVRVQGFNDGVQTYDRTVVLSATTPSFFNFNYTNVDELRFASFGGTPYYGIGSNTQFVMDNFTFADVPEPSSIALTALGLVGLAVYARRRKRSSLRPRLPVHLAAAHVVHVDRQPVRGVVGLSHELREFIVRGKRL